ncbi:unnamed protein product [Ilex paraguariensis]|uniref:Uncharacterized protein n=1 Tax=Ilex paraguariensis TaxID=185542 RepID=A0ABC8QTG5_9AQUA
MGKKPNGHPSLPSTMFLSQQIPLSSPTLPQPTCRKKVDLLGRQRRERKYKTLHSHQISLLSVSLEELASHCILLYKKKKLRIVSLMISVFEQFLLNNKFLFSSKQTSIFNKPSDLILLTDSNPLVQSVKVVIVWIVEKGSKTLIEL